MKKLTALLVLLATSLFSQLPWTPPQVISSPNVFIGAGLEDPDVDISCNSAGDAIATWSTAPGGKIMIARLINKVWSSEIPISGSEPSAGPSVSLNSAGVGYVAWIALDLAFDSWIFARPVSLTSLGTIQTVAQEFSPDGVTFSDVGVNAAGAGIVSWKEVVGGVDSALAMVLSTATPVNVGSGIPLGGLTGFTEIAVNESGKAVMIWNDATPEFVASYFNGATWGAVTTITAGSIATTGFVVIDASGLAYITGDVGGAIVAATFDGTTMSPPATIGTGMNQYPDVGTNRAGKAFIVWRDINTPAATFIEASFFTGAGWSAPVQISGTGILPSIIDNDRPQVGVDASGSAIATWGRFNSTTSTIESARYEPFTGTWSSVVPIQSLTSDTQELQNRGLDVNEAGGAISTWVRVISGEDPIGEVRASFLSPIPPSPPAPQNLRACCCTNRFLTQCEQFKVLTWDPSTEGNIAAFEIRRNGILLGTVPSSCCFFEDHNRNCCCCDTYEVCAITSEGIVGEFGIVRI